MSAQRRGGRAGREREDHKIGGMLAHGTITGFGSRNGVTPAEVAVRTGNHQA
jgi:hypothetical protein